MLSGTGNKYQRGNSLFRDNNWHRGNNVLRSDNWHRLNKTSLQKSYQHATIRLFFQHTIGHTRNEARAKEKNNNKNKKTKYLWRKPSSAILICFFVVVPAAVVVVVGAAAGVCVFVLWLAAVSWTRSVDQNKQSGKERQGCASRWQFPTFDGPG